MNSSMVICTGAVAIGAGACGTAVEGCGGADASVLGVDWEDVNDSLTGLSPLDLDSFASCPDIASAPDAGCSTLGNSPVPF